MIDKLRSSRAEMKNRDVRCCDDEVYEIAFSLLKVAFTTVKTILL